MKWNIARIVYALVSIASVVVVAVAGGKWA
jgi:hypothetical protein